MRSRLIVLTGLPGAGKSAIAEPLGAELAIPVFAKDWIEAPILKTELVPPEVLGAIGYDLLTALARRQLMLGQSVILDSVASTASIRSVWRSLAQEFDAAWLVIECICSDARLHRERMSGRARNIPDWPELAWADVERVSSYFERWREDRLILDSMEPVARNLEKAIPSMYSGTTNSSNGRNRMSARPARHSGR